LNMSTSRGDSASNVSANRQEFLSFFGLSEAHLAEPLQISRDGVALVVSPGQYAGMDALITNTPGVFLRILTADCSPILIWAKDNPVVAAVHSGWQGSELDILGKTLDLMQSNFGVDPHSLCLVLGPGLTQENFEVGPEFSDKFPASYLQPKAGGAKYFFDNNGFLRDTALARGVPADQIETLPFCSYGDDELFYSHRRDGGTTGRMMSIIGIRS